MSQNDFFKDFEEELLNSALKSSANNRYLIDSTRARCLRNG
jgi:hypothetical protein